MSSANFRYFSENAVLEPCDLEMDWTSKEMTQLIKDFENVPLLNPAESDDVNGYLGISFEKVLKISRVLLASLLEVIIDRDMMKNCRGCEIDNPSQLRHSCLFEADPDYFDQHFEEILEKIHIPWLKLLVAKALACFNFHPTLTKLQKLVEDILTELRPEPYIRRKLHHLQETLDDKTRDIFNKLTKAYYHHSFTNPKAPLAYYSAGAFENGECPDSSKTEENHGGAAV
ncbi:UNVERIFIED_CONTAM: hypothetical protein FKN15_031987 [Acipenser sinensis]